MSPDALFQLGIVSVRLNTSLTEPPRRPARSNPPSPRALAARRRMVARTVRAQHETYANRARAISSKAGSGKAGSSLMAGAIRRGRTLPEQ